MYNIHYVTCSIYIKYKWNTLKYNFKFFKYAKSIIIYVIYSWIVNRVFKYYDSKYFKYT